MTFLLSNLKEENDVTLNSIFHVMNDYGHLYMLCQGVASVIIHSYDLNCLFFLTLSHDI